MYSPFIDKKGKALEINKIQFKHLKQLKDCEEGHHVEFKLKLSDDRAQLAKEIASFANCEGGWLIVGIEDKTRDIQAIDKCDYSQRVGKIVTRITPYPEIETRFLCMPDNKKKGVLLIYVHEGKHTPYVCNGVIYVRSGSSKEPIKPAERGNVEYLLEKSKWNKESLNLFFTRDYYLPLVPILQKSKIPIVGIYIKNSSPTKNDTLNNYKKRDLIIDDVLKNSRMFEKVQYSMNSILFFHKSVLPGSLTCVLELYYDFSCKIYCPVGYSNESEREHAIYELKKLGLKPEIEAKVANGNVVLNALCGALVVYLKLLKENHIKEKYLNCCLEVENIGEQILYFEGLKYIDHVKKHGISYAHKDSDKVILDLETTNRMLKKPLKLVADFMAPAFGFDPADIIDIISESTHLLLNDNT